MLKRIGIRRLLTMTMVFIVCLVSFQNCGYMGPSDPGAFSLGSGTDLDFDDVSKAIFEPKCLTCHSGASPSGGIDLSTYSGTMAAVVAYDPDASILQHSVEDGSMPPAGALSGAEINLIRLWILGGANEVSGTNPTPNPNPTATPTPTPTPTPAPTPAATFTWIRTNILTPKCVGCHGPSGAGGGFRYDSYQNTLASVVAGNAAASPFYTSVQSDEMPKNAASLSTAEKNVIQQWINNGAQNN